MTIIVYVKTNRTRKGYAQGQVGRFMNYSDGKFCYSFKFYKTYKFFDTYKELREFVEANYELVDTNFGYGLKKYHLPERRIDFFRVQGW